MLKGAGVHWLRGEPRQCGDRAHRLIPPSLAPTGERRPSMACLRPIPAPPRLSPSGCPWLRRRRLRHAAPKRGTPRREGRRCKGISSERYMDVPRPRVGAGRGTTRRTKSPCSGGPGPKPMLSLWSCSGGPARSGCCCPCSGSPTRSRGSRFRIAEPDLVTPRYSAAKAVEWQTAEPARQSRHRKRCRGKSGLHRARCQVTPGRREPTESATERYRRWPSPPRCGPTQGGHDDAKHRPSPFREGRSGVARDQARVKWCGKSAPRAWQQAGTANPTGSKAK